MECHKKVTLSNDKNMQQYATVAKAAVSNHSQLKWHAGSTTQNKNRKPNSIIMRRNCFINVFPLSHSFLLSVGGILHSPQRSSQFLPACTLSLEGKSKGFSFISDRRRSTKHDSPERPMRKLWTPCPKYLILEEQKIACAYLFAGTKTSLVPQTLCCHWTFCRCVLGI